MKRYLEYYDAIKFLDDRGFSLNKTLNFTDSPLVKKFEYWAKDDGEEMYLLEVMDQDFVFMFKLV